MLASAHVLQAVLSGRSMSDVLASTAPELRAATQSVSFHVMRRLGMARQVRQWLVPRTPPNALFDALLMVSLTLLDTAIDAENEPIQKEPGKRSVPVYAVHTVVDQAVRAAAGQRRMQSFKGLLNGALRRFTRERGTILAQVQQNPEACWNHPEWWIQQVQKAYPDQWQALLAASNVPGPMTLRVNSRRAHREDLLQVFEKAGVPAQIIGEQGIVLAEPQPVHALPGFEQGWWSVQDASAQQAALLAGLEPGMRVLDACAAPGGKSAHMLELADIELLALDNDPDRLIRINDNLDRLGLSGDHVSLQCADAGNLGQWYDGRQFDVVLADVPCTASGVVRRHPDIRWLRRASDVAKTAALQRKIVEALWVTVKPGGRLVYATCSIFPQEGEAQAVRFGNVLPGAVRLSAPGQILPVNAEGDPAQNDGFFYAVFAKKD